MWPNGSSGLKHLRKEHYGRISLAALRTRREAQHYGHPVDEGSLAGAIRPASSNVFFD
jgi:hypothetical protein